MSTNKRRGYIAIPADAVRPRPRPLPVRLGGQSKRPNRPAPLDESDLFGIPLAVWDSDVHVEKQPLDTLVNQTVDEADAAPPEEMERPLTRNLLGVNIADQSDDDSSEEEDKNGDVEVGGDGNGDDEVEEGIRSENDIHIHVVSHDHQSVLDDATAEEVSQLAAEHHSSKPEEIIADSASTTNDAPVDDFHLALMMFTTTADISVKQYKALAEVLSIATETAIKTLPRSLKTLREKCRKNFPLASIKARPVVVNPEAIPPRSSNPRLAYYFQASEYCNLWLSNPQINKKLYTDMGEIVDNRSELWHGDAWMESVRSTSGKFATICEVTTDTTSGGVFVQEQVILPSDCVIFRETTGSLAMGRVKCVGIDRRHVTTQPDSRTNTRDCPSVVINRLTPVYALGKEWGDAYNELRFRQRQNPENYAADHALTPTDDVHLNELIMQDQINESMDIIPCSAIVRREWVYFADYVSVNNVSPEKLKASLLPQDPRYIVKYIAYTAPGGRKGIRSVHKRHRVAAELELIELTRDYVLANLVDYTKLYRCSYSQDQNPIAVLKDIHIPPPLSDTLGLRRVSLPFSLFLDGFGLYRNAYHSIKGMYITPAGLNYRERERLSNIFVLMIGPFGANEMEMATCLQQDSVNIGNGFLLRLFSGETVFATAFPLLFTGDMPQQNQNSGVKTHKAEYGCRSCLVIDKERGNLNIDIWDIGRYKAPTEHFYRAAMKLKTKAAREATLKSKGLTIHGPYFSSCYTMLDPQRANPNDSMHAELRLAKYFQEALLEGILSTAGVNAYRQAWDDIQMPYRWGQPQNPVNHKGSMVFSEHGRVAIINPLVLMHMFTNDDWVRMKDITSPQNRAQTRDSYFKKGVITRLEQSFAPETAIGIDCRHQILHAAFGIATTIHLTLQDTLSRSDREHFPGTVWGMRHLLRRIFASASSDKNFKNYANVPNIHLGLHYEEDLRNFGTIRNSTTMMGEQKHKIFKVHAPHTNSTNNDLQLLKMTNTSQTLRFILDGTYEHDNCDKKWFAMQVQNIIQKCPTLKAFVDTSSNTSQDPTPQTEEDETRNFNIEDSKSAIQCSRTGKPLTMSRVPPQHRTDDYTNTINIQKEYGVSLANGARFKTHYWGYFAGDPRPHGGKSRRFRVEVDGFIQLLNDASFYRVKRIMTTTIGSMVRVFFVLQLLERVHNKEVSLAPYPVLRVPDSVVYRMVGIEKIKPALLHFVKKSENTWWYNPFVPYFL